MSVTAKDLSSSGAKGRALDALVRDQLLLIDNRLRGAVTGWGRNLISVELPVHCTCPGLNKRDTQRILYSTIVRSLQDRGFEVRLQLEGKKTVLFIEWVADISREEIAAMNKLIHSVQIKPAEIGAYIRRGRETYPGRPQSDAAMPRRPNH